MIRVLRNYILPVLAATLVSQPAQAAANCLDPLVILRGATIEDDSGRWEDQDVLIEDGVIVAMGGALMLPDRRLTEINLTEHVLSPLVDDDVLVIRASVSPSSQADQNRMLMVGEPADMRITSANGDVIADLRNGQPLGQCFTG